MLVSIRYERIKKIVITIGMIIFFSMLQSSVYADQIAIADAKEWIVKRMLAWSKPGRIKHPLAAAESFDDGMIRYESIADDLIKVVSDNDPIFSGTKGRIKTAALILSVSMLESGLRRDVDLNIGNEARGDGGRSWCLMQIQLGAPIYVDANGSRVLNPKRCINSIECSLPIGIRASTPVRIILTDDGYQLTSDQTKGYSGQDLIENRELCFSAGLRIMHRSFNACSRLPLTDRLSAYASGNCNSGREASRRHVNTAIRWLSSNPPPVNDLDLTESIIGD